MRAFFFLVGLSVLLTSCNKDDRTKYEERLELDIKIPTGLNLIETHTFEIYRNKTFFKSNQMLNGYQLDEIDAINAASGSIRSIFSSNGLGFIENITIRVFDPLVPNSTKEMYYRDFIPTNQGSSMNLFGGLADLTPILTNDEFVVQVKLKFRSFVPPNTELRISYGYNVFINN